MTRSDNSQLKKTFYCVVRMRIASQHVPRKAPSRHTTCCRQQAACLDGA